MLKKTPQGVHRRGVCRALFFMTLITIILYINRPSSLPFNPPTRPLPPSPAHPIQVDPPPMEAIHSKFNCTKSPSPTDTALMECIQAHNSKSLHQFLQVHSQTTPPSNTLSHRFGLSQPFIPILIMCHNRPQYLHKLLQSLSQVDGIQETLLIFSHDGFFPELDNTIQMASQQFPPHKILQLFHPYASDFFPNSTLGRSVLRKSAARRHFWWAWNVLFRSVLPQLFHQEGITNPVMLLLEEDHMVTKDAYYLLHHLLKTRQQKCEECFSVNLGGATGGFMDLEGAMDYEVGKMLSSNAGLAFYKSDFERILRDVERWCGLDEYNWDWALFMLMQMGSIPGWTVGPILGRVVHIGSCGMHHSLDDCDNKAEEHFLQTLNQRFISESWFNAPEDITDYSIFVNLRLKGAKHSGYGGWILNKEEQALLISTPVDPNINVQICLNVAKDPFPSLNILN